MKKKYSLIKEVWLKNKSEPIEIVLLTSNNYEEIKEQFINYKNPHKQEEYTLFVETTNDD